MNCRFLVPLFCISPFFSIAQGLSKSRHTSVYTYVYKVSAHETWRLSKSGMRKFSEKYLHTLVDSFLTDSQAEPALPPGNYLLVHALHNKLEAKLKTAGELQYKLISNKRDLVVLLHNKEGEMIRDARVQIGHKILPYDKNTQSYRLNERERPGTLKVYHQNVLYLFPVVNYKYANRRKPLFTWKRDRRPHYGYQNSSTPYERRFKTYMAFSKPKYKPGDTLQLKAFICDKKGRPVNRPLLLRLSDRDLITDTILATVHPYRPGGYECQMVLNDSLDLYLDDEYQVTLEELSSRRYDLDEYMGDLDDEEYVRKRKVLSRNKFYYEEYELSSVTFTARTDVSQHHRGREVALYLKATDENDLAVLDGRVNILIKANDYYAKFYDPVAFLPDTLWAHSQPLDALGETRIIIPDSLFPHADFPYDIKCTFLNSNNEDQVASVIQQFYNNPWELTYENRADSLVINCLRAGRLAPASAIVYACNDADDTIWKKAVTLPAAIPLHPLAASYKVRTDSISDAYHTKKPDGLINCLAFRTSDSVTIKVSKTNNLFFWYAIYAGNKIIQRGYSDSLWYHERAKTDGVYTVSIQYVYGNKVHDEVYSIYHRNNQLDIEVKQPRLVYPGKTTDIEVLVKDVDGKPVAGADLTAFAFTSKFRDAAAPVAPYLGRRYQGMKIKNAFVPGMRPEHTGALQLKWERWSKEMGLDSLEYFRFLHPTAIYTNTEVGHRQVTQIAPFVVLNGNILPIHQVYIDQMPVFFSQAQHLQQYSFPVSAGKHSLKLRTATYMITVDSIWAEKGKKTFISIHADGKVNNLARIVKMRNELNAYERMVWSRYMLLVENNFDNKLAYIKNNNRFFVLNKLNPYGNRMPVLTGPLVGANSTLTVKNRFSQAFETEGNYIYTIANGLVKQKQLPIGRYAFETKLWNVPAVARFTDFVYTERDIDSMWQQYVDERNANETIFRNPDLFTPGTGRLHIEVDTARKLFVKNIFLFRYDNPDFMRIYRGKERRLGYLEPGHYRLLALLRNDEYLLRDSIYIQTGGTTFYSLAGIAVHAKDSMSIRIAHIVDARKDVENIKEVFNYRHVDASLLQRQISGQVISRKDRKPVIGASVTLKGTNMATVTDKEGYFSMRVTPNGTLQISFLGYETKHIRLSDINVYEVHLTEAATNLLDEVVVVGYGTTAKKQAMTASAVSYSLQGKVPGIMIRGIASDPLALPPVDTNTRETTISGQQQPPANSLRRHFRDNAFWQPRLQTNNQGKASFTVTYPDDITQWRTFFIAMGPNRQSGSLEQAVRSYKPVSGNLALPLFAIAGDTMSVIGKSLNYSPDGIQLTRTFTVDNREIQKNIIGLKNAFIDTFQVVAGNRDSLQLRYTIQKEDGYFDGEERSIPVYPAGTLETHGYFAALGKDTTIVVNLPAHPGKVHIYAEASLLPVMLDEVEHVRNYEYLCNEQLASKLKALLLKQKVYKYLGKDFRDEKEIRGIINMLNDNRSQEGLWGWWKSNPASNWISLHVAEALLMAGEQKYAVSLNKQLITDYCLYQLERSKNSHQLFVLELLQLTGSKADLRPYIDSLEKHSHQFNLHEQLRLQEIKQKEGLPVNINHFLSRRQLTAFGNMYWGDDRYAFFDNSIQNTLIMYRLLKRAGGYETILEKTRNYFLEKRRNGQWRNTYESSLILETILPDLMQEQSGGPAMINVNGETVRNFPWSKELNSTQPITVTKQGAIPVYFTAYQKYWNQHPEKSFGNFTVHSQFDKPVLKAGEEVNLVVQVRVKADADYVMIEIPIPAGCSYKNKIQTSVNNEVHREYFKNKVSIFCTSLRAGNYTFRVNLMPRYSGHYHLNPAKAEMMYFPVFNGQEGIKKVVIR